MRRMLVLALAACGSYPPMVLDYALTQGPPQACTTTTNQTAATCSDVALRCDATLSVRIVQPDDPATPFVSLCEPITGRKDLCSIAGISFPEPNRKVPAETLEVQVAIFATHTLCADPADPTGMTKQCPTNVAFDDATGLPVDVAPICDPSAMCCPIPAIGGRALYHPGDKTTTVHLGCTFQGQLDDPSCAGPSTVTVAATVNDFDTGVSVSPATADLLGVTVGEPRAVTTMTGTVFVLEPSDVVALPRTVVQPMPGWDADVALQFTSAACLEVLEDVPQSTATITCKRPMPPRIDLVGERLGKATLDQILAALHLTGFPPNGLVVGIVLDELGNPMPGQLVTPSCLTATPPCSIEYLSADRTAIIAGGVTSANGIFLSQDAAFSASPPTKFTTMNNLGQTASGLGGLIQGKVTVVVLQFSAQGNN